MVIAGVKQWLQYICKNGQRRDGFMRPLFIQRIIPMDTKNKVLTINVHMSIIMKVTSSTDLSAFYSLVSYVRIVVYIGKLYSLSLPNGMFHAKPSKIPEPIKATLA
jgi:hypothetical protein